MCLFATSCFDLTPVCVSVVTTSPMNFVAIFISAYSSSSECFPGVELTAVQVATTSIEIIPRVDSIHGLHA